MHWIRAGIGLGVFACFAIHAWPVSPLGPEWPILLLLFAPTVLAPLLLRLALRNAGDPPLLRFAARIQAPAAAAFALSFAAPGLLGRLLVLPWLATMAIFALGALERAVRRGALPLADLALDAGLAFPVVGAGWAALHRFHINPLGFSDLVVLLTAVHFHYAGFALPILTGLAARARPGRAATAAIAGALLGVPLVAAGITATALGFGFWLETFATLVTAAGALCCARLHFRLALDTSYPLGARLSWAIAAFALVFAMVLAAIYGMRAWLPISWLDVATMQALHGSANAIGFSLMGSLGWLALGRRAQGAGR